MLCETCQAENQEHARFCLSCGTPFAKRCRSCDAVLAGHARFCDQCGTPFDDTAPVERPKTAPGPVRKDVTVLFADLVGSTELGERLDPEAARDALAPYFRLLQATIEDHAGTVMKFTGDGALAVFGIPEVAEDDALRAVSAGVELQQRFTQFAASLLDRYGATVGLRVGIQSGELVFVEGDADLVGDVLNTAARLEAECTPGRVLVGEETWRLTRSAVTYEVLGEVRVRGKADPVATFQVVQAAATRSDDTTALVGRDAELRQLLDAFDQACESPIARLVTVIGAPGVGKTRLAAELRAVTDARSFDLRFERRGTTTFGPIADLLRDLTDGTEAGVGDLLADHAERDRLCPVLASFLGHGEPRSTEESFWAVRRLLERLTLTEGPLIVVVDDIQWAEPLFWDLLDHLVEWAQAPVLIVALARPELRDLRPELAQPGRRVAASIALEGLDAEATRHLAANLLDTDNLPRELWDRLPASTEGNPLFVRELVQMLVDDGTLARDGDRWRLTIDVDAIEVPPTILSLLASRVERLPDDERQVIELASVIGTEFDRGTLADLAPRDVTAHLGALLDRLRRRDVIEPSGAWAGDQPVYRFHHVLMRDAAYRRLLKGRRAELHEAVGRLVERTGSAAGDADVVVAHHFEQVVRYRRELGTTDDGTRELARSAAERLRRSADDALNREDLLAAGGYALRALDLVDDTDPMRDELLVLGCEALLSSGDAGAATPLVSELEERSRDARLAAWADCFRAQRWSLTDPERLTDAADHADRAADRLAGLGDNAGVAKARLVRATCLVRLGRVGECEVELDLALAAARTAGDRRRTVAVLGIAPLAALWGPSPVARAGGRCLDVLRLLRITTASPAVEATSVRCQAVLEALRGRVDSARDKLEASRLTATDLGLRHGLFETELFAGFVELWVDNPTSAEEHLRLAHDGLGRLGLGADAGQAGAFLARVLVARGDLREAVELASAAVESAGENLQTAMQSRASLAEARSAQGRHDEARRLIDEAVQIAERTDAVLDHAIVRLAAGRVAAAAGDHAAEREHRAMAESLLRHKGAAGWVDGSDPPPAASPTGDRGRGEPVAPTGVAVIDLDNAATRVLIAVHEAAVAGDRARLDQLVAADVDIRYTEPGDLRPVERAEFLDFVVDSLHEHGGHSLRVLAVRGDELCLARHDRHRDGIPTSVHHLVRAGDGRLMFSHWFGPDQFEDALDALDREWVDRGGPEEALLRRRVMRAASSGDPAVMRALLTDDFEAVDHRPLGFGRRGPDEFAGSASASEPGQHLWASKQIAMVGAVGLQRIERVTGGSESSHLAVVAFRGFHFARAEQFDLDDLDRAMARFDDLVSGAAVLPPLANAATEVLRRHIVALNALDLPALRDLYDPAIDVWFAEPLNLHPRTRDEYVEFIIDSTGEGGPSRGDVIAVRGDDLCLETITRTKMGVAGRRHLVARVAHGRLVSKHWYPDDRLTDALADLDAQWVAGGDLVDPVLIRNNAAMTSGDWDTFADCLAPDFVVVDHRPFGMGVRDRDQYLESTRSIVGNVVIFNEAYLRVAERASFVRVLMRSKRDDTAWPVLLVNQHDGERSVRWDQYPIDTYAEALAHYERVVGSGSAGRTGGAGATVTGPLHNAAVDARRRLFEAADRGREAVADLAAPGFVNASRRNKSVVDDVDLGGFLDKHQFWSDQGLVRAEHETVAVRGERLALEYVSLCLADGNVVDLVILTELDEDARIVGLTAWDDDQLHDALDELDDRWGEVDPPVAGFSRVLRDFRHAQLEADADVFDSFLADDFTAVDHRPIGMGERSRDDWISSTGRRFEALGGVHFMCPTAEFANGVGYYPILISSRGGDDATWEFIGVGRMRGDRFERVETFPPEMASEAYARFRELAGLGDEDRVALWSPASEVVRQVHSAIDRGDDATVDGLLHPDFRFLGRRSSSVHYDGGKDELVDRQRWWYEQGRLDNKVEIVAIRGDRLAVQRTTIELESGDELPLVHLVELHQDGRLLRITSWDSEQLDEAYGALIGRWVELDGSPGVAQAAAVERAFRAAYRDGTVDELRPWFAPTYVAVDHRGLGMGERNLDEWLASNAALVDGAGGLDLVVRDFPWIDDRCAVHHTSLRDPDTGSAWEYYIVTEYSNGLITRTESFPIDQREAAHRCFLELGGAAREASDAIANTASRLGDEYLAAGLRGDRDRMLAILAPDAAYDNRRPWHAALGVGLRRGVEIVDAVISRIDDDGLRGAERRTLAVRGDDLALTQTVYDFGTGEEVSFVVIETKNGEILTMTRFGENDLLDAHDFLDQRWAELDGSAAVAESVQNVGRARQGFATGDVELMRSALALDYVAVDHRPIGFGERTVDEWLASVVELVRRSPIEWVLRTTEQRGPVSYQRVAMRPRGDREWAWEFLQVSVFGGGVCRRVENFALSDVASARRRFDELSA